MRISPMIDSYTAKEWEREDEDEDEDENVDVEGM